MLARSRIFRSSSNFVARLSTRVSSEKTQSFWFEPDFAVETTSFVAKASASDLLECVKVCADHGFAPSDFIAELNLDRIASELEISDLASLLLRLGSLRQSLPAELRSALEISVLTKFPDANLHQFAGLVIGCSQLQLRSPEIFSEISSWVEKHGNMFETNFQFLPSVLLALATLGLPGHASVFTLLLPHVEVGNLSREKFFDLALAAATADLPHVTLAAAIGNRMLEISRQEISDHEKLELAWLAVILNQSEVANSLAPKIKEFPGMTETQQLMFAQIQIHLGFDPGVLESEILADDLEISSDVISDLHRLLGCEEGESEISRGFYVSALPANEQGIFCFVDERTFPDLSEPTDPYLRLKLRQINADRKFLYVNAHVWRSLESDAEKSEYLASS